MKSVNTHAHAHANTRTRKHTHTHTQGGREMDEENPVPHHLPKVSCGSFCPTNHTKEVEIEREREVYRLKEREEGEGERGK